MAEPEERMRILKMIEDHKITAEEGAKLLSAQTAHGAWAWRFSTRWRWA